MKRYFPVFVLPTLLAFAVAFMVPFIMGIYLSFCDFTTVTNAKFVGISNYVKAFTNPDFLKALWFTVKFAVLAVVTINICGFALALMLTQNIKGRNIFRTIFFMPNLIGGIVLGYIWQSMINGVLAKFGVTMLLDPKYGYWGLIILNELAADRLYHDHLHCRTSECLHRCAGGCKDRWSQAWQTLTRVKIPMVMPSLRSVCS